ncbi:CotH kinase family protein, partial [Aquiflexum gelatinilyticum]|uniref:CotH kinase family protein n=1 Tax=Aquiflexum gelatinilyticum TaxID=2961943 RepID=UPI00216872F8
ANFDPLTRTFSGTPLAENVGTLSVEVTADDGNGGSVSDIFDIVISAANNIPTVINPIADQAATENILFSFEFPNDVFQDLDGDGLSFSALLVGGGDLPAWLVFDPLTRTFSGTPLAENVGTLSVEVTADDGNGGTVSDIFDIVIAAANNLPTVANPLLDQEATENALFSFVFPENTFLDLDGNGFTYSALLTGGETLPEWLSFDAQTRTFSGTPLAANVGTISVEVTADDGKGGTVSDSFDIIIAAQPIVKSLIHYWNFNDELNLLQPAISLAIGAGITPELAGSTVLTFGTGQSFAGLNARNGDLAEEHLRFNLPIGSNLVFSIPTTGYRSIIVKYETRRSGSGAGLQTLSYTLDGINFIFLQDVLPVDGAPEVITLDFTSIDGVSDNPNFKIKIEFSQGTGGVEGNNRFDNITVEGEAFEGQNFAPITIGNIPFRQITKGQVYSVDLSTIFSDPNGDVLEYQISSLDTDLVNAILTGNSLEISTLKAGSATINITASDGSLNSPILSFRTLIYPEAHVLSTGSYSFTNWSAEEADGNFPPSMIFLQSSQDDPSLETELLFDYSIPSSDYAAADIANIGFSYKNTSRTRINGLGENGISFINTGRGRDLGGALLALDSRNVDGVKISFDAETLIPNFRQYNFAVLYRVGIESPWQVVNNVNGVPLVYVGKDVVEGSIENLVGYLPANGLGHEYVQVMVKYHYVGPVSSGARRMLRLDNLELTNESDPTVGTAPGNTTLLSPENSSSLVSVLPTFTWTPATDAGNYQLEVAIDNGFENLILSQQILSGTEYTLTTPLAYSQVYFWRIKAVNGFGESEWSPIFIFTTEAEPEPILIAINEIMASNASTIQDEDGTFSDWIELYNYGSETYNLEGFGLSDSDGSPFKWVFPALDLAPGQYLLIWASSKNRTNPSGPLHTTFAISSNGEPILLTSPDGVLVNRIDPLASTADISRGRFPNGSETIELFTQPTPGAANISDGVGPVLPLTAPEFSVPPGFYQSNIELNLTHPDPQAVIRYTLDGSEPTESSPVWSGAQTITDRSSEPNVISLIPTNFITGARGWTPPSETIKKATVIRAKAFKTNGSESPIKTATYFVLPGHSYTLPVVSVVTNPANLFDENTGLYVPGANYVSGDDDTGNYYQSGDLWERPASMEMYGQGFDFQQNIAIRINGNYTRRLPQKSLRIYAKGEPGKSSLDYPIFQNPERSGFQRMILRNFGNDWGATLMTDVLSQTMAKHLNVDYQHFRTSVVFINGEYWGLHNFRERYDKYYFERIYGVDPDNIDYLENKYVVSEGDANNYMEFIKFFESNDLSVDENYAEMNRWMDIENFLDYYVTEIFVNNNDWPQNNLEYWRARVPYNPNAPKGQDGRWRWIIKDLDRSFGRIISSNFNMLEWATNGSSGWATSLFRNLLKNEEFKYAFINRMSDQLNTGFKKERILHLVDSIQTIIQPEVPEHTKRWNQPSSISDWMNRIQNVKNFIEVREGFVRQHFIEYFGLGGTANIILDISDQGAGSIRINSLEINEQTLGLSQGQVYPWNGTYFKDVPISFQAIPNPGFSFSHWLVNGLVVKSQDAKLIPTQDTAIKAVFVSSNRFFSELVSPTNGSFGAGPNPNFEWNNAPDAVSYRIQVSLDPNMSQLVLDQGNLTTNNYLASNLDVNQVYSWWIISSNAEGAQDWSEIWRFSPAEEGTLTTPVLLSPGNDNQNTPLNVQLVWNDVFGADSYQLQVSVDPTFSTTFLETTVQNENSYPLSGLLENTVYYWRVRANRGTNSSEWSLVRNLKTLDLLDLNEGLVGHWKLDEGSGNTLIDHSGNGYNAIIQNTTGISWSPGVIDLGINLNGSWGRYALVPHQPNLELPNALTISTWVKPNILGRHTIISKADGNGFELWLDISGKIEFRLNRGNNGTAYRILSNFNYSTELGKWIHLAATFDGSIMRVFVNGNLDAITSFPQFGIGTSSGDLVIGALGTIQRLNGSLDDLRLYNRSLSDSDINALFIGEPTLPGVPSLTSPASGTEFPLGQEVELEWSASPQAESYQIQLAFDEDFIDLVIELDLNNALSYQTKGLLAETTYHWRVRASNAEGNSEWSSARNFKTGGSILPVTGITIDPTSANVQIGNTLQLIPTVFPSNASNKSVTWTTSNPLTVSVSSSGLVTGLSAGTATVSAITEDGNFTSESLITVTGNNSYAGLVGHWKMDEGSGSIFIDHSGNGNNATIPTSSGVVWTSGVVGQAARFNAASGAYGSVSHNPSIDITQKITIAAWIRPNAVENKGILSKL